MADSKDSKELKTEVDKVSSRVSALRDDMLVFQSDFDSFKQNVVKDLKNILKFIGQSETVKR